MPGIESLAEEPVVVAGAGPVGLAAALALDALSVPVIVLEAAEEHDPRRGSRALFLHNESLVRLERFSPGLGALFASRGVQWSVSETLYGHHLIYSRRVDRSRTVNGLPTFVSLRQPETEGLLREACRRRGIAIRWGTRVNGVTASSEHVDVSTAKEGMRASYVVAADGARSTLRRSIAVGLTGDTAPGCHIVVDFLSSERRYAERRTFHYHHPGLGGRHVLIIPFAGGWQVDLQCFVEDDVQHLASPAGLRQWLPKLVQGEMLEHIDWVSVYRFNQVVAEDFADAQRRVLLVGEAAHLFPPYGARGLNSGIADADAAARAIALARQARHDTRRRSAVEEFVLIRGRAAKRNCEAAKLALRAIRAPAVWDKVKRRAAVSLSGYWRPAARWLDTAPYGPAWLNEASVSRY